jgi:hypothetical protein
LLLVTAATVCAQDADIQRQLLQRQQATDAFNLQLRQSQEVLKGSPADRPATEARQFSERQHLDNLNDQQLRDVTHDAQTPRQLRPYELQKADMERAPFRGPVVVVPVKPAPKAESILPPKDGIRIEEPR